MAEKWEAVRQPFEREIVREVEYGIYAKNGKELVANVTSRKDANLIVAAPLMIEALTRLLYLIERDNNVTHNIEYADSTILDQARAAIAAAKGE